jgi:hypothetical protein
LNFGEIGGQLYIYVHNLSFAPVIIFGENTRWEQPSEKILSINNVGAHACQSRDASLAARV